MERTCSKLATTIHRTHTSFTIGILSVGMIVAFFALAQLTHAQQSSFNISITPRQPSSLEPVTARIENAAFNAQNATITWYVNGEEVSVGDGETSHTFLTPESIQPISVRATIETSTGQQYEATAEFRVSNLDLLWEAQTYTPPFYKGRALPSSRSLITFTAIPHFSTGSGNALESSDDVFRWQQNGVFLGDVSNQNRQSITLGAETVSQSSLVVTASAERNGEIISNTAQMRIYSPFVLLYQRKPLEGIVYQDALIGSNDMQSAELTLRAEPYFFSLDDYINEQLSYRWEMNGQEITDATEQQQEITFRRNNNNSGGNTRISVETINMNLDRVLQEAEETIRINL